MTSVSLWRYSLLSWPWPRLPLQTYVRTLRMDTLLHLIHRDSTDWMHRFETERRMKVRGATVNQNAHQKSMCVFTACTASSFCICAMNDTHVKASSTLLPPFSTRNHSSVEKKQWVILHISAGCINVSHTCTGECVTVTYAISKSKRLFISSELF